ncbi:hypothetical protein DWU99_20425 [Dyella psychrodurans]|uniref:Orc1-like AAA ATPase domain-containing protein n=1 Tax=Dyella psychrodurans TaxID=1927960 RepID=A0A370WVF4_9GAMM|nr:hypothetical protein DWU99_20425 [Dyella psychrodurans]
MRERVGDLKLAHANEAETRLKVVDDVIKQLLGWTLADIHPEERISEDGKARYIDYVLRTANTAIVIEAKRAGASFDLQGVVDRRVQLTPGFVKGDVGDAIIQARDYGRSKSIPFAVVTNGSQWIIFPASRSDQIEFNRSSAIVFDSADVALGTELGYFVSLLSRDGVVDGFLERELLGRTEDQLQERRLRTQVHRDSARPANPIFHLIENEVIDCFSDTIAGRGKDFLELCYVPTPDRTKFDGRIKMHLRRHDALFGEHVVRPLRERESKVFIKAIEDAAKHGRPLALLVLGSVGAGKTTYLSYTRQVVTDDFFASRKDREYPHWIYVDLRAVSGGERPIEAIYAAIFEYIKNDDFFSSWDRAIRSAYKDEIDSLRRGPLSLIASSDEEFKRRLSDVVMADYNNVKPYVDKLIKYASSKQPIFLVIDNVDQFESEDFQGKVFADAISFASRFSVNLVLAMREGTFVRHRNHPSFDAFDFDPLSIEAPEITAVLSRRFMVLHRALKNKAGHFTAENGARFEVDDLSVFAELIQQSVLGTEIGTRIEVLANKDVRLALRMTREFLERGYTEPGKAISLHKLKQKYVLPRHEAFRAILLGNQNVYSEAFSVIGNPFDSRLSRSSSQMLRMFVLAGLVRFGSDATAEFIDGSSLRDVCRKLGYGDASVTKVIQDLCRLRFAQTASHEEPKFSSSFFATRLGGYVVRELIADFTFLEAMLMDTFISHDGLWETLKALTAQIANEKDTVRRIGLRIERIRKFWKNLSDQYFLLLSEALRRGLPAEWCTNPFTELEHAFEANCSKVISSAQRIYG